MRKIRSKLKIFPVYKKVDTCASEFKSFTPYMYSTYQRNFSVNSECEADPSSRKKLLFLVAGLIELAKVLNLIIVVVKQVLL